MASSSSTQTPQISTPTVLVNKSDRFLILQPYGEGPAVEQDSHGGFKGGIPVYVAVKVRGQYSTVLDPTQLRVCLKCLYIRGPDNSGVVNGQLSSQMNTERIHSAAQMGISFKGLPAGLGFEYKDEIQDCVFQCIDLPFFDCSLYGWMSENYFTNGVPEEVIIYIMGRVLGALRKVHGSYTHGKICAAHVVRWKGDFFLSYAASVVDLASDAEVTTGWPYAPVCSVWRWARAPELRNCSLFKSTAEGDIWMVGVLALELAYSGLRFVKEDVNLFNDKLDAIVENKKLPAILVEDTQTTNPHSHIGMNLFKQKPKCGYGQANQLEQPAERKFTKEFQTFVFKCLCSNPKNRETAARLCDDDYLLKCSYSAQNKYPALFQIVDGTIADISFQPPV